MGDLLVFSGVSRSTLEARIEALVKLLNAFEDRVDGRSANAARTALEHPDRVVRLEAVVRPRLCSKTCVRRSASYNVAP